MLPAERSVEDVLGQLDKIQQLMKTALVKDQHYGVIPGTGKKPTLLLPGAQMLGFMFRLAPSFVIETVNLDGGHREHTVTCTLSHGLDGLVAEGVGSCSSMESKYRWRKSERGCPVCGADTIKRSQYGDKGWYCYDKLGGCGAKFAPDDDSIVRQEVGRKENPDIADTYNTILKMAKKRAFVDATLTATAASNIFTQDVEDMPSVQRRPEHAAPKARAEEEAKSRKYGDPLDEAFIPHDEQLQGEVISPKQKQNIWAAAARRAEEVGGGQRANRS